MKEDLSETAKSGWLQSSAQHNKCLSWHKPLPPLTTRMCTKPWGIVSSTVLTTGTRTLLFCNDIFVVLHWIAVALACCVIKRMCTVSLWDSPWRKVRLIKHKTQLKQNTFISLSVPLYLYQLSKYEGLYNGEHPLKETNRTEPWTGKEYVLKSKHLPWPFCTTRFVQYYWQLTFQAGGEWVRPPIMKKCIDLKLDRTRYFPLFMTSSKPLKSLSDWDKLVRTQGPMLVLVCCVEIAVCLLCID